MLHPTICSKCFQPNEPARTLCWKCTFSLAIPPEAGDYIRLFELKENWTALDLKSAFHRMARKYHPDVNPGDREADAQFKFVNQAYEVLSEVVRTRAPEPQPQAKPTPTTPTAKKSEPPDDLTSDELHITLEKVIQQARDDKNRKEPEKGIKKWVSWAKKTLGEKDPPK